MAKVKTAVSIEKTLFEKADALAKELKVSRSGLFTMALNEFLDASESALLLREIDAAYGGPSGKAEKEWLERAKGYHRRFTEAEW